MKTFKINGQLVKADKLSDAIKSCKDSAASDIVREIKAKYPNVQIRQFAKQTAYGHNTILQFSKYPGEHATGFSNDPRTKEQDNWERFLNYITKKYDKNYDPYFSVYPDEIRIFDSIKDSVKDGGERFEYAVEQVERYCKAFLKWVSQTKNPNRDGMLAMISDNLKIWSTQLSKLDIEDSTKDSLGSDVSEYQKWVDYDMKKYHRISGDTMYKIKKAGLDVVKDRYGDYEVIAHRRDEKMLEDDENEDLAFLSKEEEQAIDDYKKAIANTKDPAMLRLFSHILKEEIEHLEELGSAKECEFEDAVKDEQVRLFVPVGGEDAPSKEDYMSELRKYKKLSLEIRPSSNPNWKYDGYIKGELSELSKFKRDLGIDSRIERL